jgi:hypothetical protein
LVVGFAHKFSSTNKKSFEQRLKGKKPEKVYILRLRIYYSSTSENEVK